MECLFSKKIMGHSIMRKIVKKHMSVEKSYKTYYDEFRKILQKGRIIMAQNHLEEFREDLKEFHEMTRKFYNKEITVPEYKSFSGGFGSYAQRGGERSMLRLRLSGGEIDKDKLQFIVESMEKYQISMAHLTTCQTVQLHNLTEKEVCGLIEEAWEHGIITRGGGGDFPRNVMCTPLSGVVEDETFDVLPYAKEAADYLLGFIKKVKLPRKLKVCFSNNEKNEPHATFRDLGFVAKDNHTFDVYIAGGLGNKPKFGVKVAENVEPSKILYCIKTMVDVFTEYGNYTSRAASRTRFLQDTLGVEGLQKVFSEKLEKNLAEEGLDISVEEVAITKTGEKSTDEEFLGNVRVVKQKQEGLYAVSCHPIGGVIEDDFFRKLYDVIADMEEVKLRLTPDQGLYVINLTEEEAKKVLALTADESGTEFEKSTACIGADICQVGIGRSQAMLAACINRVREEKLPGDALPAIHISGCPSSCSAHQTAVIGLRGAKKQTESGPKDAFLVMENGCDKVGAEQFGNELGVMTVEDIPEFFAELGKAVADKGLSYLEFRKQYPDAIAKIAEKYI